MPLMRIGELVFQVHRKAIKNLHISVLPPDGRVRVSAPQHLSETAIRMAVVSRLPWIKKQQQDFADQPRQSQRCMLSGETHYVWGRRYRIEVVTCYGRQEVIEKGSSSLQLYVRPESSVQARQALLNDWYREQVRLRIPNLLDYWQQKIGVRPWHWGVRKMKTKWGSCNTEAKRIWLNSELAKKPSECLEYILVHELVHLLERNHNDRFRQIMDSHLPNWRERRALLNSMPLGHEDWEY